MGILDLELDRAHSARVHNYLLGGNTHFPADREAGTRIMDAFPAARIAVLVARQFMHRSTRHLAAGGMAQFLDIGVGIPASPDVHEIAQRENPAARVVYTDNDPVVLAHAVLLDSSLPGRVTVTDGDLTEPDALLASPELAATIDLAKPVALSLNAVLDFLPDQADPHSIVETFKRRLVAGSTLAISHSTPDFAPDAVPRAWQAYRTAGTPGQARTRAEFTRYFDGWQLLDPGVTLTHRWRPDPADLFADATDTEASCYAAVARKP